MVDKETIKQYENAIKYVDAVKQGKRISAMVMANEDSFNDLTTMQLHYLRTHQFNERWYEKMNMSEIPFIKWQFPYI